MESVGFCVRVDARDGYADKIGALTLQYDSVVAVRHGGKTNENPHYHLVIKTSILPQAFRKRMKLLFPEGKGNQHMSIKPYDGAIEAVSYLFHEDPDAQLLVQHGVSDDYITKARTVNQKVRVMVQEAKERASWKLEDDVFEHLDKTQGYSDRHIAKLLYLTALRSGKYPPQPHHCRVMTQKIQFRLCNGNEHEEERLCASLAENVFRY